MRKLLVVSVIMVLLSVLGAGANANATFKGDLKSLTVGDTASVNATIINPLPVQDTIRVTFSGSAISSGLLSNFRFQTAGGITCPGAYTCNIDVGANDSRDLQVFVDATSSSPGQKVLVGTVNSSTSGLSNKDTLDVRVSPYFGEGLVSAPGIQFVHLAVLAVLAALLYRRRQ